MLQRFGSDALSRKHAPDFSSSLIRREFFDGGVGPALGRMLLDEVMMISKSSNLWKMRDAKHLTGGREALEATAYGFGCAAADTGVDFIENQCVRRGIS